MNLNIRDTYSATPLPIAMIVPTGIGCSIGGYAGDSLPSARLLAAASGCLITHPNVMNGASLYWKDSRIHYVEGWALNEFIKLNISLRPARQQKIGLIMDFSIESELKYRHLQVADACRATLGLNIGPVVITDQPLNIKLRSSITGISWGYIDNPDSLLRAGEKLIAAGATAIAIVARFPDDTINQEVLMYRQGNGVDSLAGAEAIISHLLGSYLKIPCAHAPALNSLPLDPMLDPRAAAEELGYTFLSSVLVGLSQAPNLCSMTSHDQCYGCQEGFSITADQLGAIVVPSGALGSAAILRASEARIPIITVKENFCVLNVNADELDIDCIPVNSYTEAAGTILALREGISYQSLARPINQLSFSKDNLKINKTKIY